MGGLPRSSDPARSIPESVKRQVRQECFFGCVFCGIPVFEYEHIDDWALVKKHEASNIVLLCPTHHAAKTTKKLSRARVLYQRGHPCNRSRAFTAGYQIEGDTQLSIKLAEQTIFATVPASGEPYQILNIDGRTMMSVRVVDGWITTSLDLTDESGVLLLKIIDGEVVVSTGVWDYSYIGPMITVRDALRSVLLQICLSNSSVLVSRGNFFFDDKDGIKITEKTIEFVVEGFKAVTLSGGGSIGSGHAAIALINPRRFPTISPPQGLAFLCNY